MVVSDSASIVTALAVGHVTHDRYGDKIVPGGCAFYASRTWQALGADVTLATAVGDDFLCDGDLEGIEVERRAGGLTTVFTNTYEADGSLIQRVENTASRVDPLLGDVDRRGFDICFLAPVISELGLGPWLDAVEARLFGAGMQGFFRGPGRSDEPGSLSRPVISTGWKPSAALLSRLDAAFLSMEDLSWFGSPGFLDALRSQVGCVVVTDGERGSTVYCKDEVTRVGIYETTCVDPTGAGDTFAAATLMGLAQGQSPVEAARLGAAAASIVVEGTGGETLGRVSLARQRAGLVPVTAGR